MCPPGTTGTHCEIDARNECASNPCQKEAICENLIGDYACYCPPKWTGKNCEIYEPNYRGGVFNRASNGGQGISSIELDLELERRKCMENRCEEKSGNHHCDEECNRYACNFDGNDCSLGINPWRNCTAPINCWDVFMNGVCNEECNNAQCLFDGRDCEKKLAPCK